MNTLGREFNRPFHNDVKRGFQDDTRNLIGSAIMESFQANQISSNITFSAIMKKVHSTGLCIHFYKTRIASET